MWCGQEKQGGIIAKPEEVNPPSAKLLWSLNSSWNQKGALFGCGIILISLNRGPSGDWMDDMGIQIRGPQSQPIFMEITSKRKVAFLGSPPWQVLEHKYISAQKRGNAGLDFPSSPALLWQKHPSHKSQLTERIIISVVLKSYLATLLCPTPISYPLGIVVQEDETIFEWEQIDICRRLKIFWRSFPLIRILNV